MKNDREAHAGQVDKAGMPECDCSAKDMTFGRCCKLAARDRAERILIAAYSEASGVTDGRFTGLTIDEMANGAAYNDFGGFVAGWLLGIAAAIEAIEESQPPDTTPWDCVDAARRKLTPPLGNQH